MSLRLGALHDALRSAQGVSEEDAKKAAEEVAGYDKDLASLRLEVRANSILSGLNTAILVGVLWLVLRLGEAVARIQVPSP